MIRNPELLERFEREYERNNPLTLDQKYAIWNSLYQEARRFGHFSGNQPDDLDSIISLASALRLHG